MEDFVEMAESQDERIFSGEKEKQLTMDFV